MKNYTNKNKKIQKNSSEGDNGADDADIVDADFEEVKEEEETIKEEEKINIKNY